MSQTLKFLIGNSKGNLKIAEQTFSDEIISTKLLQSSTLIKLIFFNCSFLEFLIHGLLRSQWLFDNLPLP